MGSIKKTNIKSATDEIHRLKSEGKTIVLSYGIFNFLHIGHIRYLKEAKELGDILIVGLCADRFMDPSNEPSFEEALRIEAIASLEWVDMVIVNPFETVYDFVDAIRPDIFARGFESKSNGWPAEQFDKLGINVVVVKENYFASTNRINRYMGNLPQVVQKYLTLFYQRFDIEAVLDTIVRMQGLRVLVVGDTILDEYQYCSAIGKSSKDPMLALKYESHDLFAGGVLSVANHVAGFVEAVDLITILGDKDDYKPFIRQNLNDNINPYFLIRPNAPTLMKRRFVDGYSMNKLLEIYIMDDSAVEGELEMAFTDRLQEHLSGYDLVIAADFGHGTISESIKSLLSQKAPFLAVNAQSNAGNRGFNNITKYPRADYVSIAEHEIRVEMRDMTGKIRKMMETLSKQMKCQNLTVTRGRHGCMVMDRSGGFVQVPSFASKVVDRVGAGDALFAVSALAAVQKMPPEVIGFIGSIAGSLAVETMGNQKAIENRVAIEYIRQLTKNL